MNRNTYLCSATVSDVFNTLADAFMTFRDEFDGAQFKSTQHTEELIMMGISHHRVVANPEILPIIREIIRIVVSEPTFYTKWTVDDIEYFSEQLELNFDTDDEEFPF
ncbi:MAG: hypothetical protein GY781_15640 [Gammaproteobacteria bacterium]|nr:hypothetical protein [Pseudoalteromonas sp.]MCP4273363.1 hypothetical protein [Gammaproteobacteria bacterium]